MGLLTKITMNQSLTFQDLNNNIFQQVIVRLDWFFQHNFSTEITHVSYDCKSSKDQSGSSPL
jgi:hypothetical protein